MLYKSKNRTYYHGTKLGIIDQKYSQYHCFFITTDISYALMYSKYRDLGYIFEVHFKKPLNIFNLKSDKDFKIFNDILNKNPELERIKNIRSELRTIKSPYQISDFISYFGGKELRKKFFRILKNEYNFDGVFNYEIDKRYELLVDRKHYGRYDLPSIGIFNTDNLFIEEVDSIKDIKNLPKLIQQNKIELENEATKLYQLNLNWQRTANILIEKLKDRKNPGYLYLTEKDIYQCVNQLKMAVETNKRSNIFFPPKKRSIFCSFFL